MTAPTYLETAVAAIRCPKCMAEMARYERAGVVVDQCRDCRGIFLDRGELERLIDLETADRPREDAFERDRRGTDRPRESLDRPSVGYRAEWHDDDDDRRHHGPYRKSKKRSLFGELLEGFGD